MTAIAPEEIRLVKAERRLEVGFADGRRYSLPAELLRVESPSAEIQGHGEGKTILAGKRDVAITDVRPVGNYAVCIVFDDGHDTGLYSWEYLAELGARQDEIWSAYLAALEARGLSREA
ncbi:MAG: DUF971 domain-containing protein [Alphaproteobacteria bacterium]|nr:DUF971 domain-containing protein [Alphaproteobacteria bacterium]